MYCSGFRKATSLPALWEPSYNSSKSASVASKTDIIAQISPLTFDATATETSRDMAEPHSSSHLDSPEKKEQHKLETDGGRGLSFEGWKNNRADFMHSGLFVNRSSTACQDDFDAAKSDSGINCDKLNDAVSDSVEIADSFTTKDKVTEDLLQGERVEKETPSQPLSPHLEIGSREELKGESDAHQSLNDCGEEEECGALPGKSSVPRFVYGICNTSSFKRRKKETGKCPVGRKSSSPSSTCSFNNTELASGEHDSLSKFFKVNGYQSVSGSSGKMAEHLSVRTKEQSNSSIPLLTSKSSKFYSSNETSASQIGNVNSSFSSDSALQDEALDLTTFNCKRDVSPSGADVHVDQDTEHISYVAEFTAEADGSNAGEEEQCLEKSSKKGFLSITGLIQKRRTPMMKHYEMKKPVPDTRDRDVSTSGRHFSLDHLKGASSHPMVKYYQMIQRDSPSVRPSEVDVSNSLGDSCRMLVEDEVSSGSLEQGSTKRCHSVLPSEGTEATHPMFRYSQLMQSLPERTVDSEEELHQDGGDTSSRAQKKEGIALVTTAEIDNENDPIKRFKCKVCGRAFRHSQGLTAHKKIHSNERPFACQHCDLKFRVKQNLITHVRTHTGEKPHSCEICGRGFGQQSTLVRHLRSHTGEKPYTCEYCQRKFTQRHVMMNHVRIHTGEKPYSCKVCGKDFKEQHNLVRHVRTHTGEKPYTCEVCGNKFTQRNHLMRHAKVHIPKKHTI